MPELVSSQHTKHTPHICNHSQRPSRKSCTMTNGRRVVVVAVRKNSSQNRRYQLTSSSSSSSSPINKSLFTVQSIRAPRSQWQQQQLNRLFLSQEINFPHNSNPHTVFAQTYMLEDKPFSNERLTDSTMSIQHMCTDTPHFHTQTARVCTVVGGVLCRLGWRVCCGSSCLEV